MADIVGQVRNVNGHKNKQLSELGNKEEKLRKHRVLLMGMINKTCIIMTLIAVYIKCYEIVVVLVLYCF